MPSRGSAAARFSLARPPWAGLLHARLRHRHSGLSAARREAAAGRGDRRASPNGAPGPRRAAGRAAGSRRRSAAYGGIAGRGAHASRGLVGVGGGRGSAAVERLLRGRAGGWARDWARRRWVRAGRKRAPMRRRVRGKGGASVRGGAPRFCCGPSGGGWFGSDSAGRLS